MVDLSLVCWLRNLYSSICAQFCRKTLARSPNRATARCEPITEGPLHLSTPPSRSFRTDQFASILPCRSRKLATAIIVLLSRVVRAASMYRCVGTVIVGFLAAYFKPSRT